MLRPRRQRALQPQNGPGNARATRSFFGHHPRSTIQRECVRLRPRRQGASTDAKWAWHRRAAAGPNSLLKFLQNHGVALDGPPLLRAERSRFPSLLFAPKRAHRAPVCYQLFGVMPASRREIPVHLLFYLVAPQQSPLYSGLYLISHPPAFLRFAQNSRLFRLCSCKCGYRACTAPPTFWYNACGAVASSIFPPRADTRESINHCVQMCKNF